MSTPAIMDALYGFLAGAKPGANLVYFEGPGLPSRPTPAILLVRQAYNAGTIDLVQRRLRVDKLAYTAIKRGKPAKITDHGRFTPSHLTSNPA